MQGRDHHCGRAPGGLGRTASSGNGSLKGRADSSDQSLGPGEGKRINIYTDSRYAFATAHVHKAKSQERGLLTSEGEGINKTEILDLMKPATVSIIHCPSHQKRRDSVSQSHNQADHVAQEVAMQEDYPGKWDWTKGWLHLEYTEEDDC